MSSSVIAQQKGKESAGSVVEYYREQPSAFSEAFRGVPLQYLVAHPNVYLRSTRESSL